MKLHMICCLQTCLNWWNFKYLHILQLRRYSRAYWAWWPLFSWVGKVWLPLLHFCTNSQYKIIIWVGIYVHIYLQNQNWELDNHLAQFQCADDSIHWSRTANMRCEYIYNQLVVSSHAVTAGLLAILQPMWCTAYTAIPYRVEQGACKEPPVLKTGSLQ